MTLRVITGNLTICGIKTLLTFHRNYLFYAYICILKNKKTTIQPQNR